MRDLQCHHSVRELSGIAKWAYSLAARRAGARAVDDTRPRHFSRSLLIMRARIDQRHITFCFAETAENERIYVSQRECDFALADAMQGDIIDIEFTDEGDRGLIGRNVSFVRRPDDSDYIEGIVRNVVAHKGIAFMQPDDSPDQVFLHCSDFKDYSGESRMFRALTKGSRVRCLRWERSRGPRGTHIELVS